MKKICKQVSCFYYDSLCSIKDSAPCESLYSSGIRLFYWWVSADRCYFADSLQYHLAYFKRWKT